MYGARISLAIGLIATVISVTLGTLLGAVAGYFGGKADSAIMRFTDMVLAFPRLVLLIMIVALFSPSISVIIAVLGLTQWPNTTRIVRGDVLSLREREFIQAARALGPGPRAHHPAPSHPQRAGSGHRHGYARYRQHDRAGSWHFVPGAGHCTAHTILGQPGV